MKIDVRVEHAYDLAQVRVYDDAGNNVILLDLHGTQKREFSQMLMQAASDVVSDKEFLDILGGFDVRT